jgi:hypothetical protein
MSILDLIRKQKPETTADLLSAIENVEAEIPVAEERWQAAEKTYEDLLLDGNDAQRAKAEAEMNSAERAYRDLEVVLVKLRERHEASVKSDRRAEMVALSESLKADVARQRAMILEGAELVERLAALATEFNSVEKQVRAGQSKLAESGHSDLKIEFVWHLVRKCVGDTRGIVNPFQDLRIAGVYPQRSVNPINIIDMAAALKETR